MGSVIGVCSFDEVGELTSFKLYPLTIGGAMSGVCESRSQSGLPRMAESETARKIIEYLGKLSSPFGTKIELKDGIGIVKV